jgi:cytoskeletal protein CcmA (bactofilin family)
MVRGPTAARSTGEETASVLGRGARVRGRVAGDGDLRVEGQIEGEVAISGELTVEEGASVHGDVGASAVVVGGTLRGDVTARGVVTVRATADVEGDLGGAEVSLDEGASFHGHIEADFEMPAELGLPGGGAPAKPAHGRGR